MSAGLRQRFGIAQALIGKPTLVLLDEPTSNLDVQSRRDVLTLFKEYVDEYNCKIVIFSHILSDLEKFCDDYIIIDDGKLIIQDSISNMFKTNFNKFYSLKFKDLKSLAKLKENLQNASIEIMKETNYELSLKIKEEAKISVIRNIAKEFDGFLYPSMGILEEIFLEKTTKSDYGGME